MTRFSDFTDKELHVMESVFGNEELRHLVEEIRREIIYRESKDKFYNQLIGRKKE